jgi:hypothetical protein
MHAPGRAVIAGLALLLAATLMSVPASGQMDLSGNWSARYHEDQPERIPGPALGDYAGLPITEGARQWAMSWDASRLTLPEHQCQVHVAAYIYRGPLQVRIWEEKHPVTQELIAIKNYISTYEQTRTIWMDGRPHPSENAPHTWQGFSTGKWDGDMLTVTTTHIKQGWTRRNGLPSSDKITLIEHFIRHGDYLTHISVVNDPVFLTEPLIKSQNFVLNPREQPSTAWLWPCESAEEISDREQGYVPHYLPGENPYLKEFQDGAGIPAEAALGGAETMYPEYKAKLDGLRRRGAAAGR